MSRESVFALLLLAPGALVFVVALLRGYAVHIHFHRERDRED